MNKAHYEFTREAEFSFNAFKGTFSLTTSFIYRFPRAVARNVSTEGLVPQLKIRQFWISGQVRRERSE